MPLACLWHLCTFTCDDAETLNLHVLQTHVHAPYSCLWRGCQKRSLHKTDLFSHIRLHFMQLVDVMQPSMQRLDTTTTDITTTDTTTIDNTTASITTAGITPAGTTTVSTIQVGVPINPVPIGLLPISAIILPAVLMRAVPVHAVPMHDAKATSCETRFYCPLISCTYTSGRCDLLAKHVSVHTNERPHKCNEFGCPYKAKEKGRLETHRRTKHAHLYADSRPFQCTEPGCTYKAKEKCRLVVHLRIHTEIKPFKCTWPDCQYAAHQAGCLRVHLQKHVILPQDVNAAAILASLQTVNES